MVALPAALDAGSRGIHRAALRRRMRLCRRRHPRGLSEGGHLAVHALRLLRPPQARLADAAAARTELAGGAAARSRCARGHQAGARPPLRRRSPVLPRRDSTVTMDDGARRARHGRRRRHADQDLEQRAHRAQAAGAGEAAARSEDRSAQESDQPALPLQHAHVDLLAHSLAARHGADADHQALGPAPPPAPQPPALRDAARGARVDRRVPRHRGRPLRTEARRSQGHRPATRWTSSCRA